MFGWRAVVLGWLLCAVSAAQLASVSILTQAQEALRSGDVAKAERLYTQLSQMSGDWEMQGVSGLYDVWERRRRPEEGMRVYREHYQKNHDPSFLIFGAWRLAESGNTIQAAKELVPLTDRLKKGEKLPPRAVSNLAGALQRIGDLETALLAATQAEEGLRQAGDPGWVGMGDMRAVILEDLGRSTEAFNEFEFILSQVPDSSVILNNYSYYLAVHNKDLDKALRLVRRSLQINPGDGHTLDTEGFILLKLGRVEESISSMVKAWRRHPDIMVVRTHLAQALAKRKNRTEALEDLLDALRTEPDRENTARIDELLQVVGVDSEPIGMIPQTPNPTGNRKKK